MKKQITKIIALLLAAVSLTACNERNAINQNAAQGSITDSTDSNSSDVSVSSTGGSDSSENSTGTSESKPSEKTVGIYGKTDIPDIPCGNIEFEGKASIAEDNDALEKCLDSMVFETHSFGDYTINLIGDSVRTDKTNFPNSVYAQNLRVEVKKNGELLSGSGDYNDTVLYGSQFLMEYRLLEDRIGNYLSVYKLDTPVIAMRYYFDGENSAVTKAVEFATIQDGKLCSDFVGTCAKGAGIVFNSDFDPNDPKTMLALNSEDKSSCRVSVFADDEFNVIDKETLTDDKAGIKYTFNFSDPPQMELYTAEKLV